MPARSVIAIIVGLVAILALTTALTSPGSVDESLASIDRNHTMDNTRAEGAPQQQVVNGWTAHEYLALAAEQQARTERTIAIGLAAVIVLLVLGLFRQEASAAETTGGPRNGPNQPPASGSDGPVEAGQAGGGTFPATQPPSPPPPAP